MTSTPDTAALFRTKTAIKSFEETQIKYRDYGARDTEPDSVWQRLLMDAISGKAPTPPRCGQGWDLYASSMDCADAAGALFEKALAAIQAIESCPISESAELRKYLESYCWRYN